jgi:hypothetical protein
MKKTKVYDCFPYFNEKELLEFRIKLLNDHVDGFYIVDANHTHSGIPKELSCLNTLKELNIPLDKIKVIELELPSYWENSDNYFRERTQRNVVSQHFEDDAVYIISDCDEIINPEKIDEFVDDVLNNPNNIIRIPMAFLNCQADLRLCHSTGQNATFNTPFLCTKKHVEEYTLSDIRQDYAQNYNNIKYLSIFPLDENQQLIESGWHFSWFGGTSAIKTKMKSFLHSYDGRNDIFATAVADIPSKQMHDYLDSYKPKVGSSDPYGRSDFYLKGYPIENLPQKLFELEHLKDFFFGNKNVKILEIVLRTCDISNIHNDWRVRYFDTPKKDLIQGCVKSLINSCIGVPGLKLTVLDDHSSDETVEWLKTTLEQSGLIYEFIQLEERGYNHSAHQQYLRCRDSEYELVYSIEDDYLHCPTAIKEMIDSFYMFCDRLKRDTIVLYPFDEPSEYNPPQRTDFIVHGSNRHWRTGIFTTQVLFCKPKIFKEYWSVFELIALKYNGDYLNPRTEHYEESNTIWNLWNNGGPLLRFNPIPSLALHMQFEQQKDPYINWAQWWKEYTK